MSWLDGMIEDNEARSQDQRLGRTADKLAPGAFTGALSTIGPNLLRGAIEGGRTIQSTALQLGSLAVESDLSIGSSFFPEQEDGQIADQQEFRETQARDIGEATAKSVMDLRPDPTEVGLVGQILGEAAAVLPRTIAGAVAAGPVGAAVAAGAPAGFSSKQVGVAEGLDESTATKKGLIDAATVGLGVVLPAARIIKPILGDAAVAVGANVGLGMAGRGATAALLESNGYHSQAAQYKVMDGTALATDAIMGLAFFGLGRANFRRPTSKQIDAALTERTNQHADIDTAPGAPIDPKSAMAHQEAIHTAIDQLQRGERVEVPPAIREAEFLSAKTKADSGDKPFVDPVGTHLLESGTAAPKEGFVRLYRGEHRNQDRDVFVTDDVPDGKVGGWFSRDLSYAESYKSTQEQGRPTNDKEGRIVYVDVPESELQRYRVADSELGRVSIRTNEDSYFIKSLRQDQVIEPSRRGESTQASLDQIARQEITRILDDIERADPTLQPKALDIPAPKSTPKTETASPKADASPGGKATSAKNASVESDPAAAPKGDSADADPVLQVADEILARTEDVRISTGAMDEDGNPITVSARELLASADADIAKATQDAKGFAAAATCFLQRG